tara:strand:+ start:250 stop:405 length:156 start_codon:yes stop_codon:yes gene_type:complete
VPTEKMKQNKPKIIFIVVLKLMQHMKRPLMAISTVCAFAQYGMGVLHAQVV